MDKIIQILGCLIALMLILNPTRALAGGDLTYQSTVYKVVANDITENYLSKSIDLPRSLNNFPQDSAVYENSPETTLKIKRIINQLAVVPNAPIIDVNLSPLNDPAYRGARVFAISRVANSDYSDKEGRYLILIHKDGKSAWSVWMKEEPVQKILAAIRGFNPTTQPKAYEDLQKDEVAAAQFKTHFDDNEEKVRLAHPDIGKQTNISPSETTQIEARKDPELISKSTGFFGTSHLRFYILGALLALGGGGYLMFNRTKNSSR